MVAKNTLSLYKGPERRALGSYAYQDMVKSKKAKFCAVELFLEDTPRVNFVWQEIIRQHYIVPKSHHGISLGLKRMGLIIVYVS